MKKGAYCRGARVGGRWVLAVAVVASLMCQGSRGSDGLQMGRLSRIPDVVVLTPAEMEARMLSVRSTLQTLRGQIELFKIQHRDLPPAQGALAAVLTGKTGAGDVRQVVVNGELGPYITAMPVNPLNGKSGVGTAPSRKVGWVYTVKGNRYELKAVNAKGNDVLAD